MSPLSDTDLLRAWRAGDQEAFGTLVARHHGVVRAACARQAAPGDCDDCVQAVFLVLARRSAAATAAPVLIAWLLRTATLVCRRSRRATDHRRRNEATAAAAATMRYADDYAAPEALDHLDECLLRLPDKQRAAVTMHYLAGKDANDVAAALGTSRANAYMLLSRGVAGLRVLLTQRGLVVGGTALSSLLASQAQAAAVPQPAGIITPLTTTPTPTAVALAQGVATIMFFTSAPFAAAATLLIGSGLTASLLFAAQSDAKSTAPVTTTAAAAAATTPMTSIQFGTPRLAWSCPDPHPTPITASTPVLAGDRVLFASEESVLCFSTGGKLLWEQPVMAYQQQPAVSGQLVVFAEDNAVHCRRLDGTAVWSQSIECGEGGPSPAISGDRVIVPTRLGTIACLALASGHRLWTWKAPTEADYNCPTVSGEVFLSADSRQTAGGIECHALADGRLLWRTELPGCGLHVAVDGGAAYAGSFASEANGANEHGALTAFDLTTGAVRWTAAQQQRLLGGPVVTGDQVVAFGNRQVTAFARADGALRWSTARSDFGAGTIVVDRRGWIVLGANGDGRMLILDPHDGHPRLTLDANQLGSAADAPVAKSGFFTNGPQPPPSIGGFGPPALAEGRLYLATASGWLAAFDLPGIVAAAPAP